jgi:hypothetical protein
VIVRFLYLLALQIEVLLQIIYKHTREKIRSEKPSKNQKKTLQKSTAKSRPAVANFQKAKPSKFWTTQIFLENLRICKTSKLFQLRKIIL